MRFCLLQVSAIQSKQKSIILYRSDSISSPPLTPHLFISSLGFFLTSFLLNSVINQLINNCIINALSWKKNNIEHTTTEHNCELNSFVNIKLSLNFLLLVLVLFNILAEFRFRKMYSCLVCVEQKETFVFSHADRCCLPF